MKQRLIKFSCPTCRTRLAVPLHLAGVADHCPKCGVMIVAPQNSAKERPLAEVESPGPLRPGWAGSPEVKIPTLEEALTHPTDFSVPPTREGRRAGGEGKRSRTVEREDRAEERLDQVAQLELPVTPPAEQPPISLATEAPMSADTKPPELGSASTTAPLQDSTWEEVQLPELTQAPAAELEDEVQASPLDVVPEVVAPEAWQAEEASPAPHEIVPPHVEEISHNEFQEEVDLPAAPPPPVSQEEEDGAAWGSTSSSVLNWPEPEVVSFAGTDRNIEPRPVNREDRCVPTPKAPTPLPWEVRQPKAPTEPLEEEGLPHPDWASTDVVDDTMISEGLSDEPRPTLTPPGRLGIGLMQVQPSPTQEKRLRINRLVKLGVTLFLVFDAMLIGSVVWFRYGTALNLPGLGNEAVVNSGEGPKAQTKTATPEVTPPVSEKPKETSPPPVVVETPQPSSPSAPKPPLEPEPLTPTISNGPTTSAAPAPSEALHSEAKNRSSGDASTGHENAAVNVPPSTGKEIPAPMPSVPATPSTPTTTVSSGPPPLPPAPPAAEGSLSQLAMLTPGRSSGIATPSLDIPPTPPTVGAAPSGPVPVENPPATELPPASTPPPAPAEVKIDKVPESGAAVADALRKFLEAPTWKERIKWCQKQGGIRNEMEEYYSTHTDGPISVNRAQYIKDFPAQGGHPPHVLFSVQTAQNTPPFLAFVDKPNKGSPQVDWVAFVEFKDQSLQKFFHATEIGHKARLRMVLRRSHGGDTPDPQGLEAFEVVMSDPNPDVSPTYVGDAYALKGGSVSRLVLPRLPWNTDLPVTATLSWRQTKEGHKWAELSAVSLGWKEEERSKK